MNDPVINISSDTIPGIGLKVISPQVSSDSTQEFISLLSNSKSHLQSFFTLHQLKTKTIQPVPFTKYQPDWILGLLLLCFIILAWTQVYYRKRLRQILMAPFSKRFLNQLVRDGDLISERLSLAMGFIYLIAISLFFFLVNQIFLVKSNWNYLNGFPLFILFTLLVLVFWVLKIGLIRFLAFIFRTRNTSKEYILNILIFNILTGIFFLPFLVFAVYLKSDTALWICAVIFILFFIFRLIRGFLIGISITKFSYLFLFVYLCSLEILPLIVLLKVVILYYL
jgi:hypothetical protein